MFDIKGYYNAENIEKASELLYSIPNSILIAGGSDVLIKLREGKLSEKSLIGIQNIKELKKIRIDDNGDIYIGAGCIFSNLTQNKIIKEYLPVLGEAVDLVGGPQIRNVGTIGGNICNGAVSADSVPTLFSFNGLLRIQNRNEKRIVPIREFYAGPGKVKLRKGDVLTDIIIPKKEYENSYGKYIKYSMRNAMDIAALSCCAVVIPDEKRKKIEDIRITYGVAAPTPFRCCLTEDKLKGLNLTTETFDYAAQCVKNEINPRDSWRASKEFRVHIGGEILKRALQEIAFLWR